MKKIIRKIAAVSAALCLLMAGACSGAGSGKKDGIKVITVNFPPYDFVRQITGGEIIPEMLLTGGQDAHSYEPTAKDIVRINEADLFICTGGESDAWVDTILDSIDSDVIILRMTDCVDDLLEEEEDEDEDEHEHEHDSDEIEYDEHVWTSPKNAMTICAEIASRLMLIDPDNYTKYADGLLSYRQQLESLSDEWREAADKLDKPLIFGDRFPFAYLARDYDIDYFAAFAGCSTETEPSAAKMTALIEKAKEVGAPHIYHIEFSTEKVAEAIAEATGADIRLMHSCHTLSDTDLASGETYISLMRKNIAALE